MEIALRDVLNVTDIVTLNRTLTNIGGNVEANASGRVDSVMEPALREEPSVETTCASAVMMTLTAGKTATTTEIAMAPASIKVGHVTRPASLDTITAITPMALTIRTALKCA